MQTARLFLISSPPRWLRGVPRRVFADLRLTGKMLARSMISFLLLIDKLLPGPVPTSLSTLFQFAPAVPLLLSRSPTSTSAP
jgi:hypothetical protein